MSILPKFQAQNPAISGYSLGWASCTAFSAAMAASFEKQVPEIVSGGTLRGWTGDHIGGLNLAQIDSALNAHLSIDLDVRYRYTWQDFVTRVQRGAGAVLQGWYAPIAYSKFDAGNGFKGNHALFIPPNFAAMDPLADGRYSNVYKYHGEVYPLNLLKEFAAKLNIGTSSYRDLGYGLVYAAFTHDQTKAWYVTIRPTTAGETRDYTRYYLAATAGSPSRIITGAQRRSTKGFHVRCSAPIQVWNKGKTTKRSLVRINNPGGSYDGFWVSSTWAKEEV